MDGDAETKDGAVLSERPVTVDWNYGIRCPFCREDGFDKPGLKDHYQSGRCDDFNSTSSL